VALAVHITKRDKKINTNKNIRIYYNHRILYMLTQIILVAGVVIVCAAGIIVVMAAGGGLSPDANAKVGAVFNAVFG
jgi:hypothetical protein